MLAEIKNRKSQPRGQDIPQEEKLANPSPALSLITDRARQQQCQAFVASLKDRIRLWKEGVRDLVMELCCALHHFRVRLSPGQAMI